MMFCVWINRNNFDGSSLFRFVKKLVDDGEHIVRPASVSLGLFREFVNGIHSREKFPDSERMDFPSESLLHLFYRMTLERIR